MSTHSGNPLAHPEVMLANAFAYCAGFVVSIGLMAAALLITLLGQGLSYLTFLASISGLAMLALLAQAVLLFRLDLSETQIWKTVSLILVVPLFVLSIGLTAWMFHTLYPRTMLNFMAMHGGGSMM